MAHILQFRSNAQRTEPEGEAEPQAGAQIIIFPGVRRERHAEEPARSPHPETKRDRLELPE
jgi:hypothetical protein